MSFIVLKGVTKKYGENIAVNNISLSIKKGEIFGLLGPNGAGKTTLISMLSTLLTPTKGEIHIDGLDIKKFPENIRSKLGMVFQEIIIDEDLTAYDNLDIHARLFGLQKKEREQKISKLLELVGLSQVSKDKASTFSGGMKRKLELARGLLNNPQIMLLDEPTLGLDPHIRRNVWNYIKKLQKEKNITIILTTHYMEEADSLCDRMGIINKGQFVAFDTPRKLKKSLKGDIIEIKTTKISIATFKEMKKMPFVNDIEKQEDTIRFYVADGAKRIEKIIDFLKDKKIKTKSIMLKEPTLEDVFLYYAGEEFK